jgi:hypothetical protein
MKGRGLVMSPGLGKPLTIKQYELFQKLLKEKK